MLRMEQGDLAAFFDAFFSLAPSQWSSYLASGTSVRDCAATMRAVFAAAPASVRRRLMTGDPRRLVAVVAR
jgi:hypothetical protein